MRNPDRSPADAAALEALQLRLAVLAADVEPWRPDDLEAISVGAVFAVTGTRIPPGTAGAPAWAAAVLVRGGDNVGRTSQAGRTGHPYRPGYLSLVWGPLLEAAVRALPERPDVLLVDATGRDHPRGAGLALHLGWALGVPTVGVTDRSLAPRPGDPGPDRGDAKPLLRDREVVAYLLRSRRRTRPVYAHAAWRTDADLAREIVLTLTGPRARTPEPLRRARRLARLRRALDEGRLPLDHVEMIR